MQAKGGLMTRRTFAGLLGGAAAFAGRGLDAQPAVPTHVHDLYERSIAIDCLASPQSFNIPWPPQDQGLLDDQRANIRNSGITAINLTVNGATFEETTAHIAFWMGEVERDPSLLTIVRNAADIQAAKQSKRLASHVRFSRHRRSGDRSDQAGAFSPPPACASCSSPTTPAASPATVVSNRATRA
jgi:hypothetical protein